MLEHFQNKNFNFYSESWKLKTKSKILFLMNTIYKYYRLLIKYNIIEQTYDELIKKYLHQLDNLPNNLYDDSSLVCNKLGEDKAERIRPSGYNPYSPKHKLSKFSIINDSPLGVYVQFKFF